MRRSEAAAANACRRAGTPGSSWWAFVGMLLIMAGAMVGLGLTP